MIDCFCDWHSQTASVALSIVTSFLMLMYKTDSERKSFSTKILKDCQFVYRTGDILDAVSHAPTLQ